MGFLKGKSSLLIYEKWANMKYKYRSREFWSKGYYVDTVGKNTERIKEYIQNQLEEDRTVEQLCIAEAFDPFEKHGKQFASGRPTYAIQAWLVPKGFTRYCEIPPV